MQQLRIQVVVQVEQIVGVLYADLIKGSTEFLAVSWLHLVEPLVRRNHGSSILGSGPPKKDARRPSIFRIRPSEEGR